MTEAIRATCRAYFGVYRHGRQVVPNRCGACPLAEPCKRWCATPVRNDDELAVGRERWVREATEILEGM